MNEEIEQAIASLKHLVECRCDEAYTGRGRHDPHNRCDYADEVKIVSDHVAFIEAKLAKAGAALRELVTCVEDGCFCSEMKMAAAIDDAREALAEIKGETE
jgi:hypothetical protein